MRKLNLLGLLLLLGLPVTAAGSDKGSDTTVVLEVENVRVEARHVAGRLVERYLAGDGQQWREIATTEQNGSIGPVSLLYEAGQPAAGRVRSLSAADGKLVEEFDIGPHRVRRTVTILAGSPWIRVATRLTPAGTTDVYSFRDRLRFSHTPDWCYSPSVGGFAPDGYYKAPLVLVQSGRKALGMVPDLATLHREQLRRCNHALGLDVPSGPLLSVGFTPGRYRYHSVYGPDPNQRWEASESVENAYYLLVSADSRPGEAYRQAVRFHWDQFARPLLGRTAADQTGTDPRYRSLRHWNDWREVVWLKESREQWLTIPLPDGSVGGAVSTFRWNPKPFDYREKPSVYMTSWFNSLRTSYAMALYARRTGRQELLELAGQTVNLALKAPGREGAFKCVAFPLGDGNPVIWIAGDGRGHSTRDGFLGFDMCWTAYWLLQWREAKLPGSDGILERCRGLADFLIHRQMADGMLPTRFNEDGSVQEDASRTVMAETGPVVLFLLELYKHDPAARYLDAAKKGLSFLESEVIAERKWYDYETFWSCCRREPEFDKVTGQWPANTLALSHAVAAYLTAFEMTSDPRYLDSGEALLDYLLLYQQCWTNPALEDLTSDTMLLGGFSVQNADGEWSDARQSQFGNLLLDYYRATGKVEYLQRGVAALRAQFPVSPSENWAHVGYGKKAGMSSFHWGTGSGMAGIEIEETYLRDAVVDVAAGRGIGVNGINMTACDVAGHEIRLELSAGHEASREPVVTFKQVEEADQYKLVVNGKDLGQFKGETLAKGIPMPRIPRDYSGPTGSWQGKGVAQPGFFADKRGTFLFFMAAGDGKHSGRDYIGLARLGPAPGERKRD